MTNLLSIQPHPVFIPLTPALRARSDRPRGTGRDDGQALRVHGLLRAGASSSGSCALQRPMDTGNGFVLPTFPVFLPSLGGRPCALGAWGRSLEQSGCITPRSSVPGTAVVSAGYGQPGVSGRHRNHGARLRGRVAVRDEGQRDGGAQPIADMATSALVSHGHVRPDGGMSATGFCLIPDCQWSVGSTRHQERLGGDDHRNLREIETVAKTGARFGVPPTWFSLTTKILRIWTLRNYAMGGWTTAGLSGTYWTREAMNRQATEVALVDLAEALDDALRNEQYGLARRLSRQNLREVSLYARERMVARTIERNGPTSPQAKRVLAEYNRDRERMMTDMGVA